MGTIVAGKIVDRSRRTLFELKVGETTASDVRWDRTRELLPLLVAAERAICAHDPSAYTKNEAVALVSGAKQTLPAGGVRLLSSPYNAGAAGTTPGRAISIMDRAAVAAVDIDWPTATGDAVEGLIYDQREPKVFYTYPQVTLPWYIQLPYAADPPDITAGNIDSDTIAVDDRYETPLHDYIVGYALLKNTKSQDYAKAAIYLQRFEQSTGVTLERHVAFAPLDQPAEAMTPDALGKA